MFVKDRPQSEAVTFAVLHAVGLNTNSACSGYIQFDSDNRRPMPQGMRASENPGRRWSETRMRKGFAHWPRHRLCRVAGRAFPGIILVRSPSAAAHPDRPSWRKSATN